MCNHSRPCGKKNKLPLQVDHVTMHAIVLLMQHIQQNHNMSASSINASASVQNQQEPQTPQHSAATLSNDAIELPSVLQATHATGNNANGNGPNL